MSKNIIIQEGGLGKQLTANKLKTNLVGGGTCLWVPEDETQLGTKYITENGTYYASNDGYYGYSEVTVSGIGSVTGTDPDTGDEVEVHTGPDGEIVETVIPSTIRVITPPTNPYGIYADGQTITTDGMVVKAYLQSGDEYGTVPNSEIALDPTTATYDETTDFATATSDLIDFAIPIGFVVKPVFSRAWSQELNVGVSVLTGGPAAFIKDTAMLFIIFASDNPTTVSFVVNKFQRKREPPEPPYEYELIGNITYGPINLIMEYSYNNKTVYWHEAMLDNQGQVDYPEAYQVDSWPVDVRPKVAWTMVYGNVGRMGGHQTINVTWPRTGDGKILETSFEILVAPPYSPDDN